MSAAVVKLPTAAKHRVRGPRSLADWRNADQLPQFPYQARATPQERRDIEQARLILASDGQAALMLALACFRALDTRGKGLAEIYLAIHAGKGNEAASQALAGVRFEMASPVRQREINLAGSDLACGDKL